MSLAVQYDRIKRVIIKLVAYLGLRIFIATLRYFCEILPVMISVRPVKGLIYRREEESF